MEQSVAYSKFTTNTFRVGPVDQILHPTSNLSSWIQYTPHAYNTRASDTPNQGHADLQDRENSGCIGVIQFQENSDPFLLRLLLQTRVQS